MVIILTYLTDEAPKFFENAWLVIAYVLLYLEIFSKMLKFILSLF